MEPSICTCKIAHPVGMNASKLAKMSPMVSPRNWKRITSVTMNPINRNNFRSRNISWKSALNFFRPIDTICKYIKSLVKIC